MPKQVMDYSKTIIYKIVCNDLNVTDVYVGSTTNFVKRKCSHKSSCNNENSKEYNYKIYQTIRANGNWENWSMLQICEFPCNNLEEARAEERKHYELLNSKMNMLNPYRYDTEKKEIVRSRVEVYRDANRDEINEKLKIYRDANKVKIAERGKIKYTCCCGSIIRKGEKTRHERTHKHLEYVKHNRLGLNTQ